MTGTLISIATVLIERLFGLAFSKRLPERVRTTVVAACKGNLLGLIEYGLMD